LIRSQDVLEELLSPGQVLELDQESGNRDLLRGVEILGLAGPFRAVTPWELEDPKGVRRIAAGGYAAAPFGEGYPKLRSFVAELLARNRELSLPQQSASPWRAALSFNLVQLLSELWPSHRSSRVFFSNSGAEAIEGAVKFARAARPRATHLINFQRGYHGKTFLPLSLTPNPEYQDLFRPLLPGVITLPYGDAGRLEDAIRRVGPDRIAAVLVEPIQGEGGVILPPPGFLRALGNICRRHGILIIADEIQTGLGRTGHLLESHAQGLEPDILTLAKPLGGGLVPVGATIARAEIFQKLLGGLSSKRHSNTFGGNTLAMAVGLRSLQIIVEEGLVQRSHQLGQHGLERLQQIQRAYPACIEEVRGAGMLLALQFAPAIPPRAIPVELARELSAELIGLLGLRVLHLSGVQANLSLSSKRTIRLTPALTMPGELFGAMLDRVGKAAEAYPSSAQILAKTPKRLLGALLKFALEA
jgi:acetylornithine/succinyldiaminopimelate/putrescine aminotransferase